MQRYELEVVSPGAGRPWRATLVCDGGARRIDFDRPLALARYLDLLARSGGGRGLR